MSVRTGASSSSSVTLGANSGVDIGDVDVTSIVPGTGPTNLGKAAGASAGGTDTGVEGLFIRDDALSTLSDIEGKLVPGRVDANGAQWFMLAGALAAATDSIAVGALTGLGCDVDKNLDVDESEDAVKTSAGTIYGWHFINRTSSPRYVHYYNDTVANVVVGTTVPKMTLAIPGNAAGYVGELFAFVPGIKFDAAITIAATTGFADNDAGAPGANDVIAHTFYK